MEVQTFVNMFDALVTFVRAYNFGRLQIRAFE